jgi:hypothetical protein
MRIYVIAAIIAGLIAPAYAQTRMDEEGNNGGKAELEKAMAKKKKESEEIEKVYNETVKKTRDLPAARKMDPWANMR